MSIDHDLKKTAQAMNASIDRELLGLFSSTTTNAQEPRPQGSDLNYDALLKMMEGLPPVLREVILWDRDECYMITRVKNQTILAPLSWKHQIETLFMPSPSNSFPLGGIPIKYDNDRAEKLFAESKADMEKAAEKVIFALRHAQKLRRKRKDNPFKF